MMKRIVFLSAVIFFTLTPILTEAQTTITLQPGSEEGMDATFTNRGSGVNQGDRESLVCATWTYNGDLMNIRSLLAFDLSSIPENAIITDARLSLFYNPTDPHESWDYHTGENDLYIQRVTSEWDEHTIVWSNQPTTTTENQVKLPPSTSPTQDYLDIDVTNLLIEMANPLVENNGFMLRMVDEINYYKGLLFASSDHIDPNLWPKLEITYEVQSDCITLQPNAEDGNDASISMNSPSTNLGDHQSFTVYTWTNGGIPGKKRSFLTFDFSDIPDTATIISAHLSLYYNPTDDMESFDVHTGDNPFYIRRIREQWDESSITWNNQPNTTTNNQVIVPPSSSPTQDYLDIDVTELVKDMTGLSIDNHGFMFRMVDEINYYKSVLFASSDHADASLHPKLVVCFDSDTTNQNVATAFAGPDASSCYNQTFTISGTATNGTIIWSTSGDGTFTEETTASPTYTFGVGDLAAGSVVLTIIVIGESNTATDSMILSVDQEATADAGDHASSPIDEPYTLTGAATNGSIHWTTSGNGTFSGITTATPTYTFGTDDIAEGGVILTIIVESDCNTAINEMFLAVEQEEPSFDFNLFPNPAVQYVTIELTTDIVLSLEIFNSLGQLILEMSSIQTTETIDVSNYAGGTYTIRLVNNDVVMLKKFVVIN